MQHGLSALSQDRISHLLELGGPPRVTFKVVLPKGILSAGSGEGCHLLGLGDCLGAGVGAVVEAGCSSTGAALCNRTNGGERGVSPIKMWQEAVRVLLSSSGLA